MDKMIDNSWFLRIMALLLAFLLFFSVKAGNEAADLANSSTMTEEIENIPLEVYYDDTSLMVSGVPETVDVHITGPTNIVETTRQIKDFTLFVNLRNLTIGEHQVQVQTENLSEELGVRVDPAFVTVKIEERVTQEFRIDPEINERLLAEGYVLESITADPNTVTVTGPQSVIDAISFVKATVTGEKDLDESFTAEARVRVLANDLTKLENVTIDPEVVDVEVKIQKYSKEVPVTIKQTGTPPKGITVKSLKPAKETVRIYGPETVVGQLEEYVVEVNTGVITPTDTTLKVELKAPGGATNIAPEELTVEAEIAVDETAKLPDALENPEVADEISE